MLLAVLSPAPSVGTGPQVPGGLAPSPEDDDEPALPAPQEGTTPDPAVPPTTEPVPPATDPITPPGEQAPEQPRPAFQVGLIGSSADGLAAEAAAGVGTKVVRVSWKDAEPAKGVFRSDYVAAKRREIAAIDAAGMDITLDLGLQDAPAWIHDEPDSYLVNQFGERWTSGTDGDEGIDKGDANLIFNDDLRTLAAEYVDYVTTSLGSDAAAIRVGGGRWNELGYPVARTASHANTYWAFDRLARATSPTPGWSPGDPSPAGEAGQFLEWYLDAVVDYQQWQIRTVRRAFPGEIIVLLPSWGMRPGQESAAVASNLSGQTSAEINGEVQRGYDMARQVAAIQDPRVSIETTWIDAPFGDDDSSDPAAWTPAHYLSRLSAAHPLAPPVWGENTGGGGTAELDRSFARARAYGLAGLVWFRGEELGTPGRATLAQLGSRITGG